MFRYGFACLLFSISLVCLVSLGCSSKSTSDEPKKDRSPSSAPPKGQASKVDQFIRDNSFCHDVTSGMSEQEFLDSFPSAKRDVSQCQPTLGYVVYQESAFMYDFLDGHLISIRHVLPRSAESAKEWIKDFEDNLGEPTSTEIPVKHSQAGATQFMAWYLPEENLGVVFAYYPTQWPGADVDLFGQYLDAEKWTELEKRASEETGSARNTPRPVSTYKERIEGEKIIPAWGKVAAKIQELCGNELPDEKIYDHILQTKILARNGGFSAEFTYRLLVDGERKAQQLGLSKVFAVTSAQESMAAYGAN